MGFRNTVEMLNAAGAGEFFPNAKAVAEWLGRTGPRRKKRGAARRRRIAARMLRRYSVLQR